MKPNHDEFGVGATNDLSLRVSVATLVRVLIENPEDGNMLLALERKATLLNAEDGHDVEVIAQPFGGAIRIHDPRMLRTLIGEFHFDSEESRLEQDFRILIRPADWETVQRFCLQHLTNSDDPYLETDPRRELTEELADALAIQLRPDQYILTPWGIAVEDNPEPTTNMNARGHLTARVYRLFEARILDASLSRVMMTNSNHYSNQDLCELALGDARSGGKGRANAIVILPMERLREKYLAMSPEARNASILFRTNRLDETVAAVLEGVAVPKYRTNYENAARGGSEVI